MYFGRVLDKNVVKMDLNSNDHLCIIYRGHYRVLRQLDLKLKKSPIAVYCT